MYPSPFGATPHPLAPFATWPPEFVPPAPTSHQIEYERQRVAFNDLMRRFSALISRPMNRRPGSLGD